ncbi:CBS domain containing-hemolysin-like protein [Bacillus fengqiuensis]|nr:CBS domain containing-hemolysin-like protein [Bacillus fengqiuensis]
MDFYVNVLRSVEAFKRDIESILYYRSDDYIFFLENWTPFELKEEIVLSYPVYKENMDNIVGVFYSKLLLEWSLDPEKAFEDFIDNKPLFVIETLPIEKVFKMMLKEKKHLAIVIDEYGGTDGYSQP